MNFELILIIAVIAIIAAGFVFLALARRAVRLAIRLVLALVLVLVVVVAAMVWSWYGSGRDNSSTQQNRPANTRRGNSR
jgi:membrane protein implicated in regulation of membrane protease activity